MIIFITQSAFLLYWLQHALDEMRFTIRRRAPEAYVGLFLCCNRAKLEHELENEKRMEKNAHVISAIDRVNSCKAIIRKKLDFEKKRTVYIEGRVPKEDRGIKQILQQV